MGIATGRHHPRQLTGGDDVETGAQTSQHIQHRQVAVCLHRIANQMGHLTGGAVEGVPVTFQRGTGIDIKGSAILGSQFGNRTLFNKQLAVVAVVEIIHGS